MTELADVQDLGSCAARRVGSTPTTRTTSEWTALHSKSPAKAGLFSYRSVIPPFPHETLLAQTSAGPPWAMDGADIDFDRPLHYKIYSQEKTRSISQKTCPEFF